MTIAKDRKTFLIEIQRRSGEVDSAGQQREDWRTVRREWATIDQISGREYFNASGERATITNRIRVPFGAGVRARDRIVYEDTTYDVKSVIIDNLNLELMCVEVA